MHWIEKIGNELAKLGFDNYEQILSKPHYSPKGDSVALGTSVEVKYNKDEIKSDSIYFVFFVTDIDNADSTHIKMMLATYYQHGQEGKQSLFNKMYSASSDIFPVKNIVVAEMKNIMLGIKNPLKSPTEDTKSKNNKRAI